MTYSIVSGIDVPPKETKSPKPGDYKKMEQDFVPCCGKIKVLALQKFCVRCQRECCKSCARNKHEGHGTIL